MTLISNASNGYTKDKKIHLFAVGEPFRTMFLVTTILTVLEVDGKMTNEDLAIRIKAGEKDLIMDLWSQIEKLVIKIMMRYLPADGSTNRIELDDLLQSGFIGMMSAINDFEPSAGFSFTTYLNFHLKTAKSEALGGKSEKQKKDPILYSMSLNRPITADTDITLEETIEDQGKRYVYDDLIDDIAKKEDVNAILNELTKLPEVEQAVFKQRYLEGLPLKDIANIYECKVYKVQAITDSALRKLRRTKAVMLIHENRTKKIRSDYIDWNTNFYQKHGLAKFKTTFYSPVEAIAEEREWMRNNYKEL